MPDEREDRISVRLESEDRDALEWIRQYVMRTYGRGVGVGDSDAVRWALHTCKAGLEAEGVQQ